MTPQPAAEGIFHLVTPEGRSASGASNRDPTLTIRLFGGMAIRDDRGVEYLPRSRKTRALVAILALNTPRPVQRIQLTALLWSQREKEQARASLRQSVHELQERLGAIWSRNLLAERHHLSLDSRNVVVDALVAADPGAPRTSLLSLFQDGFLEDLAGIDPAFDEWAAKERRRLLTIARMAGEATLQETRGEEALEAARSLLRIDTGHDSAWRSLIETHITAGDRAAALFACEQWRNAMGLAAGASMPDDLAGYLSRIRSPNGQATNGKTRGAGTMTPPPSDRGHAPARQKLRLGVLDIRNIGDAPDHVLASGLTEEITTSLSRFNWISCVSGASAAAAGGLTEPGGPDWSRGGLDLVLDGTIQRGGSRVRITVRILDMQMGGEVIWAKRFDRDSADALSIQDEVGAAIVAQIDPALLIREGERASLRTSAAASPRDLILRAILAIYRMDRSSFHAAGAMLETALRGDPNNAEAQAWFAYWHLFLIGQGWADDPDAATLRASILAETAVSLDPNDARALTLSGHVRGFLMKRAAEAAVLHDRAISLNPNLALAWCFSGLTRCYLGDHETALTRTYQAIQLSPSDPHLFFFQNAVMMPLLLRGEYDQAATAGREAVELNPWFSSSFKGYLAALGHLGRDVEAAEVRARLLKLEPGFNIGDAVRRSPMMRDEDVARYAEGLRRGGLPAK